MSDEITNADRAERGRRAFDAIEHDENDPITNLYDMVTDLLHFGDTLDGAAWGFAEADERVGSFVIRMATRHYEEEVAEEAETVVYPDGYEVGIVMSHDGEPLRWEDGTVGLTEENERAAVEAWERDNG